MNTFSWHKTIPQYSLKHSTLILAICLLSIFYAPDISNAQNGNFQFKSPKQKSLTIPFRFINNLIIIPIRINNSDSMRFVFDTGVRSTILSELTIGDSVELNFARKTKLNGLGKGEPLEALQSVGNKFELYDIVGSNQGLYVLMENVFELSQKLGLRVHGLIGYDIFKDFAVEINYSKHRLTFYDPKTYKPKKQRRAVTFPLEIIEQKPYIWTNVTMTNDSIVPVKLLLDSGGSMAIWLATNTNNQIKLPEKVKEMYLGEGLNGAITGKIGRIKNLHIGRYILKNPITSFPDSNSVGTVVMQDQRNGSIGAEVLRRFNVIFDYQNRLVTFIPNGHFNDDFTYNMTGIEIHTPIPGFPAYEVFDVSDGSPAQLAGIEKGDKIVSINSKWAFEYTLDEITLLFHNARVRKISIDVLRKGVDIHIEFKIKDEL